MSALAQALKEKYFGRAEHPYRVLDRVVDDYLRPHHTVLDAGCGRTAPVLRRLIGRVERLIGVDLVEFPAPVPGIELLRNDLARIDLPDQSVDVIYARSVMEHVAEPDAVYAEMNRILRPDGRFIFLTANLWDYSALIARLVPNRLHPWIVARTEGRAEEDVFPVCYKSNTYGAVSSLAHRHGFEIVSFDYLGQYPCYFMFNGPLFLLATGYEKLISRFEALRFLRGWIFVVLRKR